MAKKEVDFINQRLINPVYTKEFKFTLLSRNQHGLMIYQKDILVSAATELGSPPRRSYNKEECVEHLMHVLDRQLLVMFNSQPDPVRPNERLDKLMDFLLVLAVLALILLFVFFVIAGFCYLLAKTSIEVEYNDCLLKQISKYLDEHNVEELCRFSSDKSSCKNNIYKSAGKVAGRCCLHLKPSEQKVFLATLKALANSSPKVTDCVIEGIKVASQLIQ